MRLPTRLRRLLAWSLLITLPWLSLGAFAGLERAVVADNHCAQMAGAGDANTCPPSATDGCMLQCSFCNACAAVTPTTESSIRFIDSPPLTKATQSWPQFRTSPPLRPPRTRSA